jgi:hypothetical protein
MQSVDAHSALGIERTVAAWRLAEFALTKAADHLASLAETASADGP